MNAAAVEIKCVHKQNFHFQLNEWNKAKNKKKMYNVR